MNRSESICNELGAKFFCKDFVYENLKYYNSSNKKVELCDALFEYASIYVPLQIKERSKNKGAKSEESWLEEVVYGEAVKQVQATVNAIKNNDIVVNDLYHQPVQINKNNLIFPIIVFDNPLINEYQRIIINEAHSLAIHIRNLIAHRYETNLGIFYKKYKIISKSFDYLINNFCTYLNDLYHKTFTTKLNRNQIEEISKKLPPFALWKSDEFDRTLNSICNEYAISKTDLSKAIDLIKSHYLFCNNIGLERKFKAISEPTFEKFRIFLIGR